VSEAVTGYVSSHPSDEISRAILHDPELFPEPDTFDPERFLNEDGTFKDDPTIMLAFGVGRRICPGRHFVDATLFMVAASVLSVFNVMEVKGDMMPVKSKPKRVEGSSCE
jgi:cytochrome P450